MYSSDDYNEGGYDSHGDYEPHTGDPQYDLEYDRQYKIPDVVKKFLVYFRNVIHEGITFEILNLYENTFPKLTEQYFDKKSWPDENEVASIVDKDQLVGRGRSDSNELQARVDFYKKLLAGISMSDVDLEKFLLQGDYDSNSMAHAVDLQCHNDWTNLGTFVFLLQCTVFLILYKELYYRDIYARLPGGPKPEHRISSFYNYCDLFNYILSADTPVPLELPDQWLWELIDEFVYQFQSFAQYRSRTAKLSPAEIEALNNNNKAWNVLCILNVLHSLVDKSNIKRQLEVYASGGDPDSVAGEFGQNALYKMLGYFSLVGLLRLHSLLGDYYQAIKVLENIELHKKSQYSQVPACQISTSYYVGFAYMKMRRYADAIRTLSTALLYVQRTKQLFSARSYQNDHINKQTDQMYHLLAICLVLHPQCVDESLQQVLREKNYHEKMYKMQYGDLNEFESCFTFACPKFLLPCPPPLDSQPANYGKDAVKIQTQAFMEEVRQQKMLPTIRSYLKLYTTLPLSKLAALMAAAEGGGTGGAGGAERDARTLAVHLLAFKHKMKNVVWTRGPSGLDGKFQSGSELDFYIDNDMIHIADTKVSQRYGDFFIRKILKFEDLNRKLHSIKI